MRIQNYWDKAGLNETVSKYYLKKQSPNLAWMKVALQNIYTLKRFIHQESTDEDIIFVKEDWIGDIDKGQGQLGYFNIKLQERKKHYHSLEHKEHMFYKMGLILSIATFIVFLCKFTFKSWNFL